MGFLNRLKDNLTNKIEGLKSEVAEGLVLIYDDFDEELVSFKMANDAFKVTDNTIIFEDGTNLDVTDFDIYFAPLEQNIEYLNDNGDLNQDLNQSIDCFKFNVYLDEIALDKMYQYDIKQDKITIFNK